MTERFRQLIILPIEICLNDFTQMKCPKKLNGILSSKKWGIFTIIGLDIYNFSKSFILLGKNG